jgi:hypothetical protein
MNRLPTFVRRAKLDFQFVLTFAAYNLVRMRNLEERVHIPDRPPWLRGGDS